MRTGAPTTVAAAGRVLVVDDDELPLKSVTRLLRDAGFSVQAFGSPKDALRVLECEPGWADAILTDLRMPEMGGLELLGQVRQHWPEIPVVIMTAHGTIASAVEAMRMGAYDYVLKPFEILEDVPITLKRAIDHKRLRDRNKELERQLDIGERFEGMVGSSPSMRELFRLVESVAPTDTTVLLLGESGTGKELIARAIQQRSRRKTRPFIPVNCSALTDTLLESELFGHVKGAFSGAGSDRKGIFEEADGGTLLLDEIGDITAATQVRLLRVLQEGEIRPVGSSEPKRVDVRVIAATHRDLARAVEAQEFREDLFYRLNVIALELPPLRSRPEDLPLLIEHFVKKASAEHGKGPLSVDPTAMDALLHHRWPGNVRELENAVQRAVILSQGGTITIEALPRTLLDTKPKTATQSYELPFAETKELAIEELERRYVEAVLVRTQGNIAEAAKIAGLDRSNLRRILRRHGIEAERYRSS